MTFKRFACAPGSQLVLGGVLWCLRWINPILFR